MKDNGMELWWCDTLNDKSTERYNNIDLLKGICILFVIFTHYHWTEVQRLRLLFPFWIDMAVPVFMIISGYVFSKSFIKKNVVTLCQEYDIIMILKRLIRFSLPFIIIFTIEQIALLILQQQTFSIKHCIITFITGGIGPGSFYYPILIQFVFIFPLIYFVIKTYDYKGLFGCIIVNCIYEVAKSAFVMNEGLYRLLLFRYITVIAFGCYFAIGKKKIKNGIWIGMGVIGTAFIILFKYLSFTPLIMNYWTGTSMIASFYIIPILKCLLRADKLHCKPIELLGKASYNIFLVQMAYYGIFAQMVYSAVYNPVLQISISMISCVLVGLGFYFLEDPMTKRVMKLIKIS